MFSGIFSTSDPHASNLTPVNAKLAPSDLYGPLVDEDLEWVCASGFITETHIWYQILEDGTFMACQVVHSAIGVWYPTIQFMCRIYDPKTKENFWRSVNVGGFVSPMPGSTDKRTSKSDRFTVKFQPSVDGSEETYSIVAQPSDDLQIQLDVSRVATAPGFKIGKGPKGGNSYFGPDLEKPEGYVFHKFWPRTKTTGHVFVKGKPLAATGNGMFVHAIQGMRPNILAARWNFAFFSSPENGGTSAIMMDFTSTPDYGKKGKDSGGAVISVGGIVSGDKLLAVTAETRWPGEAESGEVQSKAIHYDLVVDKETGYSPPSRIEYTWAGPSIVADTPGNVKAVLNVPVGDIHTPNGLIEKVDVLAEIPKVIKTVIAYAAGTKPYIYTYLNPATLSLTTPNGETVEVKGTVFNEATFIS